MHNRDWLIYNSTEDDCIEYIRCIERLQNAGFSRLMAESQALKCDLCRVSMRCTVSRESVFLGAKTC